MAFDNFTVNVVSFNETEGADWTQSRPSVTLIITPNAGYEIDVNNFTSINTLPPQVQSVSFTQSGANIDCIILYNSPQTMPASNVLIALCISGFASLIGVSVGGVVNYYTTFTSTPIPPSASTPYSGTGLIFSTSEITNLTVTAIAGYYFSELPVASLPVGTLANYSIVPTLINDAAGNLIQVNFAVNYTFPNYSVTGDRIIITANAAEIYNPDVEIQSYSINSTNVLTSGETRSITIAGITGAAWELKVVESVGNTTIFDKEGTIDSSGLATESIIFPASSVNVVYTFTLEGDLASSFCTTLPCTTGQPSIWELYQYTAQDVSFNLTSTFSSITIGAADTKSFTPYTTPGSRSYSVSASKPASSQDFIFNTTPINTDWSNQGLGDPITNQTVQDPLLITINNASDPKTLVIDLDTNIAQVGTQPLLSVLNLDNFLLSYTELTLCYAATETALCCGTSESRTVFVQGDVANLAGVTGDLYTNATFQTKAADGYYSDDVSITCTAAALPSILASGPGATDLCSSPQSTPIYFQVAAGATNTFPAINDSVFTDASGATPLNNTATIYYYMAGLIALGVKNGIVISSGSCSTATPSYNYYIAKGCPETNYDGFDRRVKTTATLTSDGTPAGSNMFTDNGSSWWIDNVSTETAYNANLNCGCGSGNTCPSADCYSIDISNKTIYPNCQQV